MKDYAFIKDHVEPHLWISVVGRNGYWPVTILPPNKDETNQQQFVHAATSGAFIPEPPSNGYLVLCGVLVFVSVLEVACFFYAHSGDAKSLTWLLQYFYIGSGTEARRKVFFFISASLVIAATDYLVFLPIWWGGFKSGLSNWSPKLWYLGLCVTTLFLTLLCIHRAFLHEQLLHVAIDSIDKRFICGAQV